jgi:fumarate hydratase subunit beta
MKKIITPLTRKDILNLEYGDEVLLSGKIYTARDQAHKRIHMALRKKMKVPFGIKGAVIYYCGPTKPPKGKVIGSCGPTTSSRMDLFTPFLLKAGLSGMIGKGNRSREVKEAIRKYKGVYFLAYAGCGALISKYVKNAKKVAYFDLGPEQIMELEVKDLPLIVGIDSRGRSIYG